MHSFITRLGNDGGSETKGLDMTKWTEMVAFDILGEMVRNGDKVKMFENHFLPVVRLTSDDALERLSKGHHIGKILGTCSDCCAK
jgi:hypothetical protein